MCRLDQVPNWPTFLGSLSIFAALAAIPNVTSTDPSGTILALQNKENLSCFLFNTQKAKATVLIDTGVAENFMDLSLAQSLGLLLFLPDSPGCRQAVKDLLYPVIVGVGWWRCHLVQIDVLSNKLYFSLYGVSGFFLLLSSEENFTESCLSLQASPETHPLFIFRNCIINAILIWPSNINTCKDLVSFFTFLKWVNINVPILDYPTSLQLILKLRCCLQEPNNKMLLTTGAVSFLVTSFTCTFSGPSPIITEVPKSPKVLSPPLEEDITDSPKTPMIMMFLPGLFWALSQFSP
ncbi:hypothetical protein DSO57_1021929 [Entomophthora muscae]|uniref:Uncharacterized protein n=1 Tax=Entomophthora muscae TaxID=34485 RepID=A0ACC2UNN4_9FUNG|nr:hypothetical protein DSO57_1021929 [Entomophthora muscae]